MTLRLGIPSKGRLMEKTFDWFGARGVAMSGAGREYVTELTALDGATAQGRVLTERAVVGAYPAAHGGRRLARGAGGPGTQSGRARRHPTASGRPGRGRAW